VTQLTTQPASWEWIGQIWALFPVMLVFAVLFMAFKTANKVLEPEVLREVRPIAEEAVRAKALPAGGY